MKSLDKKNRELGIKQIGNEAMGITEYRLPNGLKVLLAPNHSAPVITYMQLFRVGSRNEGVGNTGSTHFLEHMMFKGTQKFDPEKGLDTTELFNRIGAFANATTWFDRTNYFEAVPSQYLEFCIKVEADRMRNLRLRQSDRDSEMSVVRNELERGDNSPDEALDKEIYAIAFREHPYHHPTIGWRTDVEGVPMERLKAFYDQFYWPNNCTVIVVGDFETEKTLQLIHKYYNKIPTSPEPIAQVYTQEPAQEGQRRYVIKRTGDLARVWIGYHVPRSEHEDHYAINVVSHVLGGTMDRSSRLYKALIETGMAMDAFARHDELRDPSLFIVGAVLTPEADPSAVEKILVAEVEKLAKEPVSQEELKPIYTANRKGSILARADQIELAFALGEAESRANWRWLVEFDDKFEAVKAEDIMRVAGCYFTQDNSTTGHFIPKLAELEPSNNGYEGADENAIATVKPTLKTKKKAPKLTAAELEKALSCPLNKTSSCNYAERVKKTILANGMTVLYMPNPGTGSVAVSSYFSAGSYYEPQDKQGLSDIVAEMLTRGCKDLSKLALAQISKEMGIIEGLHLRVDAYAANFGACVVNEDLPLLLSTFSKIVRHPLFLGDELGKLKVEWSARIIEDKNNTGPVAANTFNRMIYPAGFIFHSKSFDEQLLELNSTTISDLQEFHKNYYSPQQSIITVVGDIEHKEALAAVEASFGDWKGHEPGSVQLPPVSLPDNCKRVEVYLPDKSSMDIIMGHPIAVKTTDPDYYPLQMANLALGGDTIIARLGKVVREQAGLTYGIYSRLGDTTHGWAPWCVKLSVNPVNCDHALELVQKIMDDFKRTGITSDELSREATGSSGLFTVGMRSSIAVASVLTRFEALGLGAEGVDQYPKKLLAVKKSQVNEAIEKYLHPDRMITVLAGTLK